MRAVLAELGPVRWADVLRALCSSKARSLALDRYRAAGFTIGDFQRGVRAAREAMAEALTRTEDRLDHRGRDARSEVQLAIADIRRRLEWELWP